MDVAKTPQEIEDEVQAKLSIINAEENEQRELYEKLKAKFDR